MKYFVFILLLISSVCEGQSRYVIRADSTQLEKVGGNNELILLNGTRTRTGAYLKNTGTGRTGFFYAVDSAYISGNNLIVVRGNGNLTLPIPVTASLKSYAPLLISNDTIYERFNVLHYGAVGDGVTNSTTAIQNCINAAAATKYGKVFIPSGTYIVDGLTIPVNISGWSVIEIEGESYPSILFGTVGTTTMPTAGSIIKSSSTTTTVLRQIDNAGGFSLNHVVLRNLDIRTYDSTLISAVDMGWAAQLSMFNCYVNTDTYNVLSKVPKVGTIGIITPKNFNGAWTYLNGVIVTGFDIGFDCYEHTYGDYLVAASCRIGYQFEQADHPSFLSRAGGYRNSYNIIVAGAHYFTIDQFNSERVGAGQFSVSTAWQQRVYDLEDAGNLGRGSIVWSQTEGGVGQENSFTKNGGQFIFTNRITNYALVPFKIQTFQDQPSWLAGGATTFSSGSGLGVSNDGLGVANQATLEISRGVSTSSDTYYADIIQSSDQTGVTNVIGRNIWVNKQSGDADKRLVQTSVSTNGAADAGIFRTYVNSGSALTLVQEMDATNFNAFNVTAGVGTKALRYNPGTGKFTYADTTAAGGASQWTTSGSDIYYSAGNIAVGSSTLLADNSTFYAAGNVGIKLWTSNTGTTNTDGFNFGIDNSSQDVYINQREAANLFVYVNGGSAIGISSSQVVALPNLGGTGSRTVLAAADGTLSAPVSDRSAKQNIKPLYSSIGKIMQLKPVSFEYKEAWKNFGEGKQIGFIAQDIQKVLPNSTFITPSTGKMGYNEIDLVPLLVKAMQEQQKQIDELRAEIKKLKK